MKKQILKINILLLSFLITMPKIFNVVANEETVLTNILNSVLDIILWIAYAIALGALLFFAIKYMLSGANERANLKGMLPKYLIGFALIVLCFNIASGIAEIAGNDDAIEIVEVGKNAGNHLVSAGTGLGTIRTPDSTKEIGMNKYEYYLDGKINVYSKRAADVTVEISDDNEHAIFSAPETLGHGEKLVGWSVTFPNGRTTTLDVAPKDGIKVNISADGIHTVTPIYQNSSSQDNDTSGGSTTHTTSKGTEVGGDGGKF